MFYILALYLLFEGVKIMPIFKVLTRSFGGCSNFLAGVGYLDLDWQMVTVLLYNHVLNFASLSRFEGAKNIYIHKILILGFGGCWRLLTWVWHRDLDLGMVTGL